MGPEFDKDADKAAVIVSVSNNLISAGATFRSHCFKCIEFMGY